MEEIKSRERSFLILLIFAMAIWGFTWSAGKFVVGVASPEVILFWRFVVTFFSYIPVVLFTRTSLKVDRVGFFWLILASAVYTIYNVLFLLGLQRGLAGAGGILVTTLNPIFTFILLLPFQKSKVRWLDWVALAAGLIGGFLMLGGKDITLEKTLRSGNLYFVLAAIAWTFVSFTSRSLNQRINSYAYGYYVYGISILFSLLFTGLNPFGKVFYTGVRFWLPLAYIAIVSTTFATTIYFFAAAKLGSARASSFIFLVPLTAMLGAMLFLGEMPGTRTVLGGILAIGAVVLMNQKK